MREQNHSDYRDHCQRHHLQDAPTWCVERKRARHGLDDRRSNYNQYDDCLRTLKIARQKPRVESRKETAAEVEMSRIVRARSNSDNESDK